MASYIRNLQQWNVAFQILLEGIRLDGTSAEEKII
jgi:hypothetical protein